MAEPFFLYSIHVYYFSVFGILLEILLRVIISLCLISDSSTRFSEPSSPMRKPHVSTQVFACTLDNVINSVLDYFLGLWLDRNKTFQDSF